MKQKLGVVLATAAITVLANYVAGETSENPGVLPPTPTAPSYIGDFLPANENSPTPTPNVFQDGDITYFTNEYGTFQSVNDTVRVSNETFLRKAPFNDAERAGGVAANEELNRIGIGDNNWCIVIHNDAQAYIPTYYLRPVDTSEYQLVNEIVYATEPVNVRRGGSTDYEVIGMLNKGDEVTRTGVGANGWSCIYYCGEFGYVNSEFLVSKEDYLSKNSSETMNGGYEKTSEIVKAKETVNIRSAPSVEDSIVLGSLNEGETATRLANGTNGWSKINWRGRIAYVKSEFLEVVEK